MVDAGCFVDRTVRTGDGTAYTSGSATNTSICNTGLPNTTLLRAAIAQPDFMSAALCGACAQVTGDAGTAIVLLDDLCPGCSSGDLDFTNEALIAVAGSSNGRFPIRWQLVPCPVSGQILYDFQGSNPFFLKLRLSSHRTPLSAVAMLPADAGAYLPASRTNDDFWQLTGGGPYNFPLTVRATDRFGQQVQFVAPTLTNTTVFNSGAQFPLACQP